MHFKSDYPEVGVDEKRFLNSGGIIGYANSFYEIISSANLKDSDDDQLFYTKTFLDSALRVAYITKKKIRDLKLCF